MLKRYAWLGICLWLVGCATTPPAVSPASSQIHHQHLAALNTIQHFSIKGRLGVNSQGKGFSGGIAWSHHPDSDSIDIFNPLGSKVAHIDKSPNAVVMTTQDGSTIHADTAESLTEKAVGIRLPLNGLKDWVLGRPTNATVDAIDWDALGRISKLSQQGWEITYPIYNEQQMPALPSKITLRNEQLQLRLLVETWQTALP